VAGWKPRGDDDSEAVAFFASDAAAAATLERDLLAFADDSAGVLEVSPGRSRSWSCRDDR
jgi:hypothetical protein